MLQRTLSTAFLTALLLTAVAVAHEGHHHTAMGTIEAVDDGQITLAMDEKTETFRFTDETTFTRGEEEVARDDAALGERAVVMYETKDKIHLAIEVKLPPTEAHDPGEDH